MKTNYPNPSIKLNHSVRASSNLKFISGKSFKDPRTNNGFLHVMILTCLFLVSNFSSFAQCVSAYQLDWSNPATYTTTCGTVVPAQWTVKKDSCNYYSPIINVGGMIGEPDKVVSITVRINQSGNLSNNDFAWIHFIVNGAIRKIKVVRGDTVSAVFTYTDTIHVPAGGNFMIRIALKTDLNTEFWQIKNGDISGCISSTGTLPVELLRFSATLAKGQAIIEWATASEINNSHFRIQRSREAAEYIDIGRKNGAGNSTSTIYYTTVDLNPIKGYSYYRLIQTDYDGKETYYGPVVLKNLSKENSITVYPNPVSSGTTSITLDRVSYSGKVLIHTSSGKLFKEMQITDTETGLVDLDINGMGSGVYFLSVIYPDYIERTKLVIK